MKQRIKLFGMHIDALRMGEAVSQLLAWIAEPAATCRYVVTPNVDHAVMHQGHAGLRAAYADAAMVLADGMPVVLASRLLRRSLPERVAGSDLTPALFDAANQRDGLTAFLLGAGPGVAERAAENIMLRWPKVRVVGVYSPPLGFEQDAAENAVIIAKVNAVFPNVLLVGLGAPKQELWVHHWHRRLAVKTALCVGAAIDFLAGEKSRAPIWMRKTGTEWLHRLACEPRRLLKRYARDAIIFPQLVWGEMIARRGVSSR